MVERVRRGRQATALLLVLAFFFLAIPGTFWLGSPYRSWLGSENVTLEAVMGAAFIGSLIAFAVPVGVLLWSRIRLLGSQPTIPTRFDQEGTLPGGFSDRLLG
jgi:hypothetical protein